MKDKIFSDHQHLSKQQIKDYLDEQLSPELRFKIENHLLDCELCFAAVEGYSELYDFETHDHLEQLETKIDTSAKEVQLKPRKKSFFNQIAAAASIALIAFAGWLYWNNQSQERLYARYFDSYQSEQLALRGEDTPQLNPMLEKALATYRSEDYLNSIPLFESYLENVPQDIEALFHAGLASLEVGQSRKAVQYLEMVRFNDEQYYEDASWYLALAHLKLQQNEDALSILKDLQKIEKGYYDQQVKDLLDQLSN